MKIYTKCTHKHKDSSAKIGTTNTHAYPSMHIHTPISMQGPISSMDQEGQVTRPGLEELSPEMARKIIENRGVEERPKASPSLLR